MISSALGPMTMPAIVVMSAAWGALIAWPVIGRAARIPTRRRAVGLRPERSVPATAAPGARLLKRAWARRIVSPLRWGRDRRRQRAHRGAMERSLPLMLDVLTLASRAGYTPRLALRATAQWSPPEIAAALRAVESRCRLGAGLARALDELAVREPVLAPVAEVLAVAERSGAPTADLLSRLADESRAAFRRRAETHARRIPVRLLFPLVFLVLPAFGLLTVVPALLMGLRDY